MMNTDHVDWENTAKETCVEIIKALREELRSLRLQYQERGYAMKETGDMVRSLYIPKVEELLNALDWLRDGIDHFTHEEDADQREYLIKRIEELLTKHRGPYVSR